MVAVYASNMNLHRPCAYNIAVSNMPKVYANNSTVRTGPRRASAPQLQDIIQRREPMEIQRQEIVSLDALRAVWKTFTESLPNCH